MKKYSIIAFKHLSDMFKKIILKNGLRLIEVPMEGVDTATSLVLVGVGSRYENKKNNGIAHLIEHLAFKGTKKRPSAFQVAKDLDSIGALYNAFTGEEYTGFYVKSRASHLEKGLEIISDVILNSLFRKINIDEEKKVIIEEIRMYHDTPIRYAEQLINNLLFAGNPLGYDTAGSEASVKGIGRKDIINFRAEHYLAKNAVVVIAGKIKGKIEKLAGDYLNFENKQKMSEFVPFKPKKQKQILIDRRETKQAHLRLAAHGLKLEDPWRYAYHLLGLILGGSMSSRLFEEIREKRSLAYYVSATADSFIDCGSFVVRAGVNCERLEEAVSAIKKELEKSAQNIKNEEINRAKEMAKGQIALEKEDSQELAWFCGFQELLESKTKTYEEIIEKIDAVSKADIKKVAGRIFNQKFYLALVGQGDEEKLLKLISL